MNTKILLFILKSHFVNLKSKTFYWQTVKMNRLVKFRAWFVIRRVYPAVSRSILPEIALIHGTWW